MRRTLSAIPVFLLTWLVYSQVAALVMHTWRITGDEPHYLLAAHSMVYDRDLDLHNNYRDGDYRAFYPIGFLDPHVRVQPDGAWLLSHDVGLSAVLAPAYAQGGRLGVMRFLALMGGLLAAQVFLLGWEAGGRMWAGLLAWVAISFSAPTALYVFQIYPEMIGGLLVLWAMRQILGTPLWLEPGRGERAPSANSAGRRPISARLLLAAAAAAALPWLSGRYAPLLLLLLSVLVWRHWRNRPLWLIGVALGLGSMAGYLGVNLWLYGGPTPSTAAGGSAVAAGFGDVAGQQVGRGLAAWWFDQQRGLLVYGPALVVALFGLPHLARARGAPGLLLAGPAGSMWLLASVWGGFYIGWEISARFLIVGLPLLGGAMAAAFGGMRLGPRGPTGARLWRNLPVIVFWPLAAGALALGIVNAGLIFLDLKYALKESPVKFYEEATRWRIRRYLPALGTRYIETPKSGAEEWTAAAADGPRYLHQSDGLDELSIGWYNLYAQARLAGATQPEAAALTFDIYSSESGIPLMHAVVRAAEADPATGVADLALKFYDPYYNKWDFPLYLDIQTTGAADVKLSWLLFEPDPVETYKRVAAWLGGIVLLAAWFFLGSPSAAGWAARPETESMGASPAAPES